MIDKTDKLKLLMQMEPKEICTNLTFQEAMQFANYLFNEYITDTKILQFALSLTLEIKNSFKENWDNDWKNEVFLANMFSVLWHYEDEYSCYKNALSKIQDPPDSLLLRLAGGNNTPGSVLKNEEAREYLLRAINKKMTYEAAMLMLAFAKDKKNLPEEKYWNNVMKELKEKNIHTEIIIPDILRKS